ncbi:hypothetical protein CVS40_5266 [Lucilia cuprina]|nr:hypothetical protein CVS40_5266 [Lucilia cuprina]
MISECEAAQGNVVPSTFRDPVDYAIVSFENTFDPSQLPVKARHIVTDYCGNQTHLYPAHKVPNTSLTRRSMSNTTASPSGLGQRASLVGKSTINFDKISFEETNVAENATTTKARPSINATASPEIKTNYRLST